MPPWLSAMFRKNLIALSASELCGAVVWRGAARADAPAPRAAPAAESRAGDVRLYGASMILLLLFAF